MAWLRGTLNFKGGGEAKEAGETKKWEDERWDVEHAHDAAVREVAALLAKPDNLGRLGKITAEYEAQRLAVQVQISMLTGRQAEEARVGIDMLARCRENIEQVMGVREKLVSSIDMSERVLPQYPALRRAWIVRRNLERTIADLEAILVMPMELARIEAELTRLRENAAAKYSDDSLSSDSSVSSAPGDSDDDDGAGEDAVGPGTADMTRKRRKKTARARRRAMGIGVGGQLDVDKSLPSVHKSLLQLERRQQAALYAARDTPHKHEALKKQLSDLDGMFDRVSARVCKIIQNCVIEAEVRPAVLVKMLQMVERQEEADSKVREAMQTSSSADVDVSSANLRCWYGQVLDGLHEYMDTKFEMLCSSLTEVSPVNVPVLIGEHGKIMDDIVRVKDLVEPCFPPSYRIFQLFVERYHALLVVLVGGLMDKHAASLSAKDIIDIVSWLRDYHGQLEGLEAQATPVLTEDIGALLQGYNFQIESMMRSWSSRMLDDDMASLPESTTDGKLYTVAPIDLFKMIDQQFEVVDALGLEKSTYALAVTVTQVLDDYRLTLYDLLVKLWREIDIDHIVAQVNNSARCVECCLQLLDELTEKLPGALVENIELQDVADGFTELSKIGAELLGRIVVDDLRGVMPQLFTSAWYSGDTLVADCIYNTIRDYGDELRSGLLDSSHRKALTYILDEVVILVVARLLNDKAQTLPIDADFVVSLDEDVAQIATAFVDLGLPRRMITPRLVVISHLSKLLSIIADAGAESSGSGAGKSCVSGARVGVEGRGGRDDVKEGDAGAEAGIVHKLSLEDLGIDLVVGDGAVAASAGRGSLQEKVTGWYREALKDAPDLPCDSIARLLRRQDAIDKKVRVMILNMCADVAASVAADKGDLLKGPAKGVISAAYKELGAKPLPGAATEGLATTLYRSVTSSRKRLKSGDMARRRANKHVRQLSKAYTGPGRGPGGRDEEVVDAGSHALDIMWRLNM